jgi:hypothetical protein
MTQTEATLATLLLVVARLARMYKMDDFQVATAQSLAWLWSKDSPVDYPPSHWARLACRHVHNGRDLPGCAVSRADALEHSVQGAGMDFKMDTTPGPDVLAAHREQWERITGGMTDREADLTRLKLEGMANKDIARTMGVSEGRASQIARAIAEEWEG